MRCGMFLVPSSAADVAVAVVVVVAVSLTFLIRLWHYKCKTAHKAKQCRARLCTHRREEEESTRSRRLSDAVRRVAH